MKIKKSTTFCEDKLGLFQTLPPKVLEWYRRNRKKVDIRFVVYNVTHDNTKPDLYKRTINLSYFRKIRKKDPPIKICDKCEKDPCECVEVCEICKENPCICLEDHKCPFCEYDPCICHLCPDCDKDPCECPIVITNRNIMMPNPKTNEVPIYELDNSQWTATIKWYPNDDKFKPITVYLADITITPKEGFTVIGIPEDGWRVNGVQTICPPNSTFITFGFPETEPIDANNIVPPEEIRASFILVDGIRINVGMDEYMNAITSQGNANNEIKTAAGTFRKSEVIRFGFDEQWNLTQIPNNFLSNFINLRYITPIPSIVTSIGNSFMLGCTAFDSSLRIPSGVTQIGNSFMGNCNNFTHLQVGPNFVNAVRSGDNSTLSVTTTAAKAYQEGIYVEGLSGSELIALLTRIPNRDVTPFRKIKTEHLPSPMQTYIDEVL